MTRPKPHSKWSLDTRYLGRQIHVYERLDSSNTLALALGSDPANHGIVLLTRDQTAGRGQYGRSWQAPPGSSVLMSVLLFPPATLRRPSLLTAWAAVSVCEAIQELAHLQASIKWPNDVLIDGKKVCGILIEQRTTGLADFPLATVAGIGLNVTQSAAMLDEAGLPGAASLASTGGTAFSFEEVARALIHQLDRQYGLLESEEFGTLERMWQERLGLLGKEVVADAVNHQHRGRLLDVTFASIDLEPAPGSMVHLAPESVRQLRAIS